MPKPPRVLDRPRQIAVAYRAIAQVNHYMVGITASDMTWEEMQKARQHLIAWQNKSISYGHTYRILDRALDQIEIDIAGMERRGTSTVAPGTPLSAPDSDRPPSPDPPSTPRRPIADSDGTPSPRIPYCLVTWMDACVCPGNITNRSPGTVHICELPLKHEDDHNCACGASTKRGR